MKFKRWDIFRVSSMQTHCTCKRRSSALPRPLHHCKVRPTRPWVKPEPEAPHALHALGSNLLRMSTELCSDHPTRQMFWIF